MFLKKENKDYINDKVVIYPFEDIEKSVNSDLRQEQEYDILHYGNFKNYLMDDFNKELLPYVKEVLDEYEYDGSVVYDEYITRHEVFVAVTRVIEKLKGTEYFEELTLDDFDLLVDRYKLLRADVETMLLSELFFIRRVQYAKEGLLKLSEEVEREAVIFELRNNELYVKNEFL